MAIYKRSREVELAVRTGFEPASYEFQIRRSNHPATLPPCFVLPAIQKCERLQSFSEVVELKMRSNEHVDKWEISRDRIVLKKTIGLGAFGAVWRARFSQLDGKLGIQTVAVKCFTRKIH